MKKLFNLTQDGLEELKQELKRLLDQRHSIAERIKQARELGDLSENAEYQDAKSKLRSANRQILSTEDQIKRAVIIKSGSGSSGKVSA